MDLLRSWLYGHETPQRFSQSSNSKESNENTTFMASREIPASGNDSQYPVPEPSRFEKLALKVVPLEPGDCLGCKLVGTSVMIASGVIVLTSAMAGRRRNPSLTGRKLTTYYAVCGSLFIGFEAAAACRFFDLGPFGYLARLGSENNHR